ncbi:MAG: glycosyltransferase [Candidatus Eremiobacteraeota bacterium]|nr:glycosyltransferase [Candidatus Eremiobacteraeota bacterium]
MRRSDAFEVAVVGGLRAVKDPLRAAYAVRSLPPESRIRVTSIGPILEPEFQAEVASEAATNVRFRWAGPLSHARSVRTIAQSDLLALTSRSEGGANVIGEAVTVGVPIVSSHIDGSIGLLGSDYPGFYPVADTAVLQQVLRRVETEPEFLMALRTRCESLRPLFEPQRERASWERLISEAFSR